MGKLEVEAAPFTVPAEAIPEGETKRVSNSTTVLFGSRHRRTRTVHWLSAALPLTPVRKAARAPALDPSSYV